jgi:methyl-accepting chemotaxis protein
MQAPVSPLTLTPEEKALVRKYLPALREALPGILEDFYGWVMSQPDMAALVTRSGKSTKLLANKQLAHWLALFETGPDAAFEERARRIGAVHHMIGLTPHWYISGYSFVTARVNELLGSANRFSGRKATEAISAFSKILMFDMQAALSVYSDTAATASAASQGNDFANNLMDSSVNVSIAVNEASIRSGEILRNIQHMDGEAQAIGAAIEQTSAGIQRMSETTQTVADIANSANERASTGAQVVNDASTRMNDISRAMEITSSLVTELADSSRTIGAIVETIENIASQTNLLALNATIEAARAGEAGKGFAVVANEVQSLSKQTATATEEIRGRIESLLTEMTKIETAMTGANDAVESGQDAMTQVSETMQTLRDTVADVSGRMDQVTAILREQTAASDEVAAGIAKIATDSAGNVKALSAITESMDRVEKTTGGQLAQFVEFDVPHKVLRIAMSDHVIWKKRLADMLTGRQSLRPDELADHHSCRLGKLYYSDAAAPYRDLAPFRELETPHADVHRWGLEAAKCYNAGDIDGAHAAVEKVETASARVLELLEATVRAAEAAEGEALRRAS